MRLNGKHKRNVFEFVDCKVVLKYGKLQRVWFAADDLAHGYLPKNTVDFEFEKYSTARAEFYPRGYNYLLTYESENGTEQVFLKLNWLKVWRLNWILKRSIFQSNGVRAGVVVFLITSALSLLWAVIVQISKLASQEPNRTPQIEHNEINTNSKKDSLDLE